MTPDPTLIEQVALAEEAVELIAEGNFYEDYDQSTAALGHLRALLATLQGSAALPSEAERLKARIAMLEEEVLSRGITIERVKNVDYWEGNGECLLEWVNRHDG